MIELRTSTDLLTTGMDKQRSNNMQMNRKYKIEKAASTDTDRNPIRHVLISDGKATATNGRMIAVVPCAVSESDIQGTVTPDSLKYARTHTLGDGALLLHLSSKESVVAEDTAEFPRALTSHTKGLGEQLELIRDTSAASESLREAEAFVVPDRNPKQTVLTINPKMLLDLANALGDADQITLSFVADMDNIVSTPLRADGFEGAYGAICPIRAHDDK